MNGAAYEVQMQASAVGVDATASQITALADSIDAASKVCTPFDSAMGAANAQMAQARAASATAASALQGAENKYAALEREATKAAKAMERAGAKGDQSAYLALARQAHAATEAVAAQAIVVDKARDAATAAAAAETKMATAMKSIESAAKGAARGAGEAADGAKLTSEQFGLLVGEKFGKLARIKDVLGAAGIAGVALLAAFAVAKLAMALGKCVVSALEDSFALREAAVNTEFLLSGMLKSESAGAAMYQTLRRIQGETGLATDKLTGMVKQLRDAKLHGTALDAALEGLALREAATGDSGIADLLIKLNTGATTAKKFNAEMHKIYGDMVAKHQLGLTEQFEEAKRKLGDIFAGVNLGPLESAAKRFIATLDRPEVIAGIQKVLGFIVDKLGEAVDWAGKFLSELTPDDVQAGFAKVVDTLDTIASILGVCASAAEYLGTAAEIACYPFIKIYQGLEAIKKLMDQITAASAAAKAAREGGGGVEGGQYGSDVAGLKIIWDKLRGASNDNGAKAGQSLDAGTAAGIDAGTLAEDAAARLGARTLAALQESLDAHSPSRKAKRWGLSIPAGTAEGIDEGAGDVRSSVEDMVGQADEGAKGSGRGAVTHSTSTSRGGNTYHVTINAPTGEAEDIRKAFDEWLQSTLDGEATAAGAGQAPQGVAA